MNINKMMILSGVLLFALEKTTLTKEATQVKKQQFTQSKSKIILDRGDQLAENFMKEMSKVSINKPQIKKAYEAYNQLINYAKKNKKMVINKSTKPKLKKDVEKLPSLMILADIPIPKSALSRKGARK